MDQSPKLSTLDDFLLNFSINIITKQKQFNWELTQFKLKVKTVGIAKLRTDVPNGKIKIREWMVWCGLFG